MKLVRFGERGKERPGIWLEREGGAAEIVDVNAMVFDIADYDAHFWRSGGVARLQGLLGEPRLKTVPAEGVRLGVPVVAGQVIAAGKNYAAHAREFDGSAGKAGQPVFFAKAAGSLWGPFDDVPLPPDAKEVDAEAELAFVLGNAPRPGCRPDEAAESIAGWCVLNDLTDRGMQKRDGQWFAAKSRKGFGPIGPWVVTADEFGLSAAGDAAVTQRLNGVTMQDGRTRDWLTGAGALLAAIAAVVPLAAGDVVSTGTPGGIGSRRNPPIYLRPGDVVECGVWGVGTIRNRIVRAERGRP